MPIRLIDLIAKVPAEVEARVKKVRDRSRSVIQEALRTECRLVMRTPDDAERNLPGAQVPVEIIPGHPVILDDIEFPGDFELILLLSRYRSALKQVKYNCDKLEGLRKSLNVNPNYQDEDLSINENNLTSVKDWAGKLLKLLEDKDPIKKILMVNEDVLGVYIFHGGGELFNDPFFANKASIRIYWAVVGLVADWMGCEIEDLSIVVLTHELAHAYTQLGADIEGRRWPATSFSEAETKLTEGLAQYYTDRTLERLKHRYPGALKAYEQMLKHQKEAYTLHKAWVNDYTAEAVRRAMLEVRRWNEKSLDAFKERLEKAHKGLNPDL